MGKDISSNITPKITNFVAVRFFSRFNQFWSHLNAQKEILSVLESHFKSNDKKTNDEDEKEQNYLDKFKLNKEDITHIIQGHVQTLECMTDFEKMIERNDTSKEYAVYQAAELIMGMFYYICFDVKYKL